jgi:hypothetical protein
MTAPPGKIAVLLTNVQVDLIGEALMEQISHLADRLSKVPHSGTTGEEIPLLTAYLELAKIIMDRNAVTSNGGAGASASAVRVIRGRTTGSSYLQNPGLRLRQP